MIEDFKDPDKSYGRNVNAMIKDDNSSTGLPNPNQMQYKNIDPNTMQVSKIQEQEHQLERENSNPMDVINMQDPFKQSSFNETDVPDVPIQDQGAAMLNALLNDDVVPEKVKEDFWFVFHRDNVLSFLDKERKTAKLLNFDILKLDSLHSTPYYDYTFKREYLWNAARHMFETKLDRALGMNGKNERLTIPMTIQETINRNIPEQPASAKSGFLKRMLNRR